MTSPEAFYGVLIGNSMKTPRRKHVFTTHSLPISFLLKELKSCCGSVMFLGIQPAQLEFMSPLTPAMHEAVEKIYGMLKA